MNQIERLLFLGNENGSYWRRSVFDSVLAFVGAILVTGAIFAFHLYPRIHNISLLYLLIVWSLATTRGLYSAFIASIVAFLSFDFFLIEPLYTFTINQPEEWLALLFFLGTAILTGLVASELRQSAEEANLRAHEERVLYELVSATNSEESVGSQLEIVANAVVDVFFTSGVRDCSILLPDSAGKLIPQGNRYQSKEQVFPDEEAVIKLVITRGQTVDLHDVSLTSGTSHTYAKRAIVRSTATSRAPRRYLRFIPLKIGQRVVGSMRLLIEGNAHLSPVAKSLGVEREEVHSQTRSFSTVVDHAIENIMGVKRDRTQLTFFVAFLDQAVAIIERARLRQESLQVEVLQRTDALRAALLSSVSHDLRTPLASIKAAASSLLQEDVVWDDETQHSFAQTIEREADRLNRLVGNLLDMSRIEGGALKPEKEWYPLAELIYDVLDRMKPILQGRAVQTDIPDNIPPVELDYLEMDQVLTNLIENAVRYTPAGSPIEVCVQVESKQIIVSVADRGPGVPAADRERIFDKFYRVTGAQRNGTISGSGLGLAVCRGLVEAHGGRIWAENREGGGTVFRFTLPLVAVS